jgi:hypothetical protein
MNMAVNRKTLLRLFALLFMALSLLTLVGCGRGSKDAPLGSTVTIKRMSFLHAIDSSITYTNSETWRVSVADKDGNPLNGIDVKLEALIGQGQNVTVNGQTGNAGDTLTSTITMRSFGFKDFLITASDQAIGLTLPFPDPVTAAALVSVGGLLIDGTYTYTVTAKDASTPTLETVAQSTASAVISNATTSANSVRVSWQAVAGATGYNVYGRTGTQGFLATIPTSTTGWIDTGSIAPGAAPPPLGTQPPGISVNVVKGTLGASTGAVTAVGTLDFTNNTP